jgi:disulfide bond formation protein DsbB
MKQNAANIHNQGHILNVFGVFGISLALLMAFYYQLFRYELPCPLCLLQRAGMIAVGLALMMNVRFGEKGVYYGMALLGAVATGVISSRQVMLHIVPGSGSYGSALFGFHLYTWTLIASVGLILYVALMLIWYRRNGDSTQAPISKVASVVLLLFVIIILANLIFTTLECGLGNCVDKPSLYDWLVSV